MLGPTTLHPFEPQLVNYAVSMIAVLGQKYEHLIHVGAVGILCRKTQMKNTF